MEFLVFDPAENNQLRCDIMMKPGGIRTYLLVLPFGWLASTFFALQSKRIARRGGVLHDLTLRLFSEFPDFSEGDEKKRPGLSKGDQRNRPDLFKDYHKNRTYVFKKHLFFLALLQGALFVYDYCFFGLTLRLSFLFQLIWLGFSPALLQVRPMVQYLVMLSKTRIKAFICVLEERRASRNECVETRKTSEPNDSWCSIAAEHRKLELDISNLWKQVSLGLVLATPLPFATLSFLHLVADNPDQLVLDKKIALLLAVLAGMFLVGNLFPIASISSMFNSSSAFKGVRDGVQLKDTVQKTDSVSIAAVVRSYVAEIPERTTQENTEYNIFLDQVESHKIKIFLGIRGFVMFGIDRFFVFELLLKFVVQMPMFCVLLLGVRDKLK